MSDHGLRILLLTYISPAERFGAGQRTQLLAEALGAHGEVDILFLRLGQAHAGDGEVIVTRTQAGRQIELRVGRRGLSSLPRFDVTSAHVTRAVRSCVDLNQYDLIVSRYIKPALKLRLPPSVPLLVDFDDALFAPPWSVLKTLKMRGGAVLRLLNDRVIVRNRLRYEKGARARYLFCRASEMARFPWLSGDVLPNVPRLPARLEPPDFRHAGAPALVFIGLMDYLPNEEAVAWFLAQVWPRVAEQVPAARFVVAGQGSVELLRRLPDHRRVEALGVVPSAGDAYALATAAIVPVRSGGGSNIKALEPYAFGRMVIATGRVRAAHGDVFREGQDILTADDPATFAAHCVRVLNDPELARRIAASGYERIRSRLNESIFKEVVGRNVRALVPPPPCPS